MAVETQNPPYAAQGHRAKTSMSCRLPFFCGAGQNQAAGGQVIGQKPKHRANDLLFWPVTPLRGGWRRKIAPKPLRVTGQKPQRCAGYLFFADPGQEPGG